MRKTITYREITVAIGVLVAMVIALTLWVNTPADKITGSDSPSHMSSPKVDLRTQVLQSLPDLSSDVRR